MSVLAEQLDAQLTDQEREVYLLRQENVKHADIGARLKIGENASKKSLQRVKDKALQIFDFLSERRCNGERNE